MKQIKTLLWFFWFLSCMATMAQIAPAPQLTPVPPKPDCNPNLLFSSTDCKYEWKAYTQALAQRQREELQLYVNRQAELASSHATAPLQQQIIDLNKLVSDQQYRIKKLQEQVQADTAAAQQIKSAAHTEGLQLGTGIGMGATLLLGGLIFGVRRLTKNFTITKKSQVRAASA